jgi:DNA ligase-1
MNYEILAQTYEDIVNISGTLEKIDRFAALLKEAIPEEIDKIIALTQAKLHPDWKGEPEIGIAEKMAVQIVASASSTTEKIVKETLRKLGDIGAVAEKLLADSAQATLFAEEATILHVYNTLDEVAKLSGSGSTKMKASKLVGLLTDVSPLEAKFILRTITGTQRLGLSDMGILDSLSVAFTGSRDARPIIEGAYNVCSDMGKVACTLVSSGLDGVKKIEAQVGIPIKMMAAKKLTTSVEILEKAGNRTLVEYKYDGERVQIHKLKDDITLFSRRQEIITQQYPDVVEFVRDRVEADSCILEAECVAIDPVTGKMRPFQELMRRRRKEDIDKTQEEVPVALYFFDILYLDSKDITHLPLPERRKKMEEIVNTNDRVLLTKGEVTDDPDRLDAIFMESLDTGHEGVIAKAVHNESGYQAGSRSWLWIKLKASYKEGMADSVDLVIVGAIHGRGKRAGVYGAILASAYNQHDDTYPTVCKIGTGFTDEMLVELKKRLDVHIIDNKSPKVHAGIDADVWFEPIEVIEVIGDEITVSPTHPAAKGRLDDEDAGLAIRFPRFTGKWRDDKSAIQATTVDDIVETFFRQRSRGQ